MLRRRTLDLLARLKRVGTTPIVLPTDALQWATLFDRLAISNTGSGERSDTEQNNDLAALESGLGRAIEHDELRLVFQPRFDARTGRISGAEALLRWQHPDLGLLPPARFISYADQTGVILPLSRWVLRNACLQIEQWEQQGLPALRIGVNLTPHQFSDPKLVTEIVRVIERLGIAAHQLELEITESVLLFDPTQSRKIVTRLKKAGVRIALDEFGIGYSSLLDLQQFNIDIVKIDRSLIRTIPQDHADTAIVEAIIAAAKKLHIRVAAVGVEQAEQVNFLRRQRCDDLQGFFFSEPLSADDFAVLVRKNQVN
jgi:EAL domain-containing protein (putative c-di-GMP-specific phosphodiesterase class I)